MAPSSPSALAGDVLAPSKDERIKASVNAKHHGEKPAAPLTRRGRRAAAAAMRSAVRGHVRARIRLIEKVRRHEQWLPVHQNQAARKTERVQARQKVGQPE